MEGVNIQNKIKLLFEKVVEPGYVLDNYYADGLINKLSNCSDPESSFLKSIPLMLDLITKAISHAENSNPSVKVFLIRMLGVVAVRELHYSKIFSKIGDIVTKDYQKINSPAMHPSLRVAYMEVALALVQHDSGTAWLLETGVWKNILNLGNDRQTVFVVRQIYKFASKFLWKLNDLHDETSLKVVLTHLLKPLFDYDFLNMDMMTSEEEDKISRTLEPTLQMLLSTITEKDKVTVPNSILNILHKEFNINSRLFILFDRVRKEDLSLLTLKSIFWLLLGRVFLTKPIAPETEYSVEDFMEMSVMYFNTVQYLVQRRAGILLLDFCNACNNIWATVWKDYTANPESNFGEKLANMQSKLIFMCLVPCFVYMKSVNKQATNERLDECILKLLLSTCEHTARAAYAMRDLTLELGVLTVTLQSVKRFTCSRSDLNNENANLVFQSLFYLLHEYDPTDEDSETIVPEKLDNNPEEVLVMTYVLDAVLSLVKNHDINWHKTYEVLCLYNIVYNILRRPNLSCKFIVTALNVITVTVEKFMPPNLSLLMESKPGSNIHELGKLIYMKMHDRNWEVRDSALELLLVCTEISFIKFPPFQKQIMENNLINVAATIAFNDHEFYVQVSALKCIGAASRIYAIWEQLRTQYPDIQERLLSILRNSQEGIVRKEACVALFHIWQNIKHTPEMKQIMYENMWSSALSDFHWEVQLIALKFWKLNNKCALNHQGMLDDKFPPVTFSKGSRKIVTLNETEIQRRLLSMLEEVTANGCLTVLVKLLNEDTEVEILEAALAIAQDLLNILDQYKVTELIMPNENDPKSIDEVICNIIEDYSPVNENDMDINEIESSEKADNVIEGILNVDDVNLLAGIYERHMKIQGDEPKGPHIPRINILKPATPYLFLNHMKSKDFKAIIEQKRKWRDGIRSLSSLLDDALGIYEINEEINTLDCY